MCASPTRPADQLRGTVLFVHGLWMTGAESFLIKRNLAKHGWNLRAFPYSSFAEPVSRVAQRCARYALLVARRTLAPVHLVGHSLGGLVIYRMFETDLLAPDRFSGDFCRVVFMGTPVRGTQSGRTLARLTPLRKLLGAAGTEELLSELPRRWQHKTQLGVIAGDAPHGLGRLITRLDGPNDGTVAVSETAIEGATDRCVIHASHMGMLVAAETAEQIARFLEAGHFDRISR